MQSCLWYNKHISENQMFLPLWFKKGIYTVGDITDSSGKVLGLAEINAKFNLKVNFYFRLRTEIQSFIRKNKKDNFFPHQNPVFSPYLHLLMHQEKGCKDIYLIINETDSGWIQDPSAWKHARTGHFKWTWRKWRSIMVCVHFWTSE